MHLFIDTTDKITFGLLGKDLNWIEYFYDPELVISTKIHALIHQTLEKHNLRIQDLTGVIHAAGPGSYTGMRVSEGISQILDWQNIKVNSFYHYEVPEFCDVSKGVWIANAFKGEFFIYKWDGTKQEKILVKKDKVDELIGDNKIFSTRDEFNYDTVLSAELIKTQPNKIFTRVLNENLKRELYYYRPIEQEFSRC